MPLSFFVKILPTNQGASQKEEGFKLNLVLNRATPSVLSLFEDAVESLNARQFCQNKKQLTFTYHNQTPVSLLISKDDLKIRLQSATLSSLWFVTHSLVSRLLELYTGKQISNLLL